MDGTKLHSLDLEEYRKMVIEIDYRVRGSLKLPVHHDFHFRISAYSNDLELLVPKLEVCIVAPCKIMCHVSVVPAIQVVLEYPGFFIYVPGSKVMDYWSSHMSLDDLSPDKVSQMLVRFFVNELRTLMKV